MKRIVLALALVLGVVNTSWAGTGRSYVPISACRVGGTGNFFGTGTAGTDSNGAPIITLAAASEQWLTCEFWFPGSATTTSLHVQPMLETTAVAACGNLTFYTQYEVSTPASNSSNFTTNNAADAGSSLPCVAVPLSTGSRIITTTASCGSNAWDQGSTAECSPAASCANAPGRFRLTRQNTGCATDSKHRGFYVYWTTAG